MLPVAKQSGPLSASERQFIDDVAALMVPWGTSPAVARVYGYLLLGTTPVGLDRIAADLEISKSSACVAARELEGHKLARRHSERGSKRVLYGVGDNFAGVLLGQSAALGDMGRLLQGSAPLVASGAALKRLNDMAAFCLSIRETIDAAIEGLSAGRVQNIRPPEK